MAGALVGFIMVSMTVVSKDSAHELSYVNSFAEQHSTKHPGLSGQQSYQRLLTGNWFGYRDQLAHDGLIVRGSLRTDASWNLSGGLATRHSAFRSLLTVGFSLRTNHLLHIAGGRIYISYQGLWGQDGNRTQLGSLQGFAGVDAPPFSELYELYYDQRLGSILNIRIGRQDASDYFGQPPDAQKFLNPSPTTIPTLIRAPFSPESAPAAVVVIRPIPTVTFKFGAYYFNRYHPTTIDQLFNTLEPSNRPNGTFFITEGDYHWHVGSNLPGVLAVGASWRTGRLQTLNGSFQSGAGSWYAYVDQTLWAHNWGPTIAGYEIISGGDRRAANNRMDYSSLGGLLATGLIPSRPDDQIGLAYNWVHISALANLPKPYELGFEAFYSFNFPRGISITPDLQYFIHDGGGVHPDALMATIRLTLSF